MSEKYTGMSDDRRYKGRDVDVTYSLKRCIHAAECVKRLGEVFDTQKRPWIQADKSTPDAVVGVVSLCPSGALHVQRKDGAQGETIAHENVIIVHEDGYYEVRGDLSLVGSSVAIEQETRAALCRCGLSKNKPFCDNSHLGHFTAPAAGVDEGKGNSETAGGRLVITFSENGPIKLAGSFELRDESGKTIRHGQAGWLCRCGHSRSKPFCDNSHKRIGFQAP